MITTILATKREEFRKCISRQRVENRLIFSPDEVNFLTDCTSYEAVEFLQENETDDEFFKLFAAWLHERPKQLGHVDYYILFFLRRWEMLTNEQFEYMERNVAECFDTSHGWIYEINNRMRFKLRIKLICSYNKKLRRLTRKDWTEGKMIDEEMNG